MSVPETDNPIIKLDWAQLPAARTVRPYFRSIGMYTTWNKDGFALQMHGPLPMAGLVMLVGLIVTPGWTRVVRSLPYRRRSSGTRLKSVPLT